MKINCPELKESDIQLVRNINGDNKKPNKLSHEEQFKRKARCIKRFEDYTNDEIINNSECFIYEKDDILNSERIDYLYTRGIAERFIMKEMYLSSSSTNYDEPVIYSGFGLNRIEIFFSYNGEYEFKEIFPKINNFLVNYIHGIDKLLYGKYDKKLTKFDFISRFCNPSYMTTKRNIINIAGLLSVDFNKEDYKFIFNTISQLFSKRKLFEWLNDVNFDDLNILKQIKEFSKKLKNIGIELTNGKDLDETDLLDLKNIFTFN